MPSSVKADLNWKIFGSNIFFWPKSIYWVGKYFGSNNFFGPNICTTQKKFRPQNFLSYNSSNLNQLWLSLAQLSPSLFFFYVSSNRNSDSKVALAAQSIIKFTQGYLFMVKNIFVKKSFGLKLFGQNKFLVKDIFW